MDDLRPSSDLDVSEDFDPAEHQVADVRSALENKKLDDGLILVHEGPSGTQLFARVANGRIIGYDVARTLSTGPGRARLLDSGLVRVVDSAAQARTIRCWHCYRNPDGSVDCFQVPCPFTAPRQPQKAAPVE